MHDLECKKFWQYSEVSSIGYESYCKTMAIRRTGNARSFGNIQKSLASAMNPIVKPWPFGGLGIDLIGSIFPPSSKGHKFVLVAIDNLTKWVKAIPLKEASLTNVIVFI